MRSASRIIALLALWAVAGLASAQNLVQNPSFETPAQVSWTPIINGLAGWFDSAATPPTTAGANGVDSDQGAPSSQILYQDIVLPTSGTYVFQMDAGCAKLGGTANDFCRVDLTNNNVATLTPPTPGTDTLATTGGNVLQTVLATDGTTANVAQGPVSASIVGTAGQTVRIRFMVTAQTGPMEIDLDNVSFAFAGSNAVPTLSQWSLLLLSLLVALSALAMRQRRQI